MKYFVTLMLYMLFCSNSFAGVACTTKGESRPQVVIQFAEGIESLTISDQKVCNRLMVKCPFSGKLPLNGQYTAYISKEKDNSKVDMSIGEAVPFINLNGVLATGGMLLQRYHPTAAHYYTVAPTTNTDWYFHPGECKQF